MKDYDIYHIDGEIQPFCVHEIHYDDARYFMDTLKGGKLSTAKDDAIMKVTKTTKLTQKKVLYFPLKPHFGSDTESSEKEVDDASIHATYPSSRLHETNQYFGSDDSNREGASLLPTKKEDDDESLVKRSFHVTRVPEGFYKALDELNVNTVE